MSEETHDDAEQIFDSEVDEVADDATDTEENQEDTSEEAKDGSKDEIFDDNSEDEHEQEDQQVPTKAEKVKLDQISAYQEKLDKGEITLKDIPKAQSWVTKYLKTEDHKPEVDAEAIHREVAKELYMKEKQELQFLDLKDQLNAASLSKEQRELIKEKYKKFILRGFPKFEALAEATEFARVDFTGLAERKRRMSIPHPSTKKKSGEIDESSMTFQEITENFPPEKVAAYLKSQLR